MARRRRCLSRWICLLLLVVLTAGCGGNADQASTMPPAATPDPTRPSTTTASPSCPPVDGVGTVAPALAIYSITFLVNDREQVVRDGETLDAAPGDIVRFVEVEICAHPFTGAGGDACVEVAPIGRDGGTLWAQGRGTHTQPVRSGFGRIPGPDQTWIVEEDWQGVSAVLNHWPPEGTTDAGCGPGRCERDDFLTIPLP